MVQIQFGDRSVLQFLVLVWSKVAELCSMSNNIRLHMEAAKLLPDPKQSWKYHGHFCTILVQ